MSEASLPRTPALAAGGAAVEDARRAPEPHAPEVAPEVAPEAAPGAARRVVRMAPASRWPTIDLGELWAHRGLFFFLVWRDIKVRYAQTVLGGSWALLQPLLGMVVFSLIFGKMGRIPSGSVPYPVFSLTALVPWTYFTTALTGASNSLVNNQHMVTKVAVPRLVIPCAPVLGALMDFAIAFVMLLVMLFIYGIVPSGVAFIAIPLLLLTAVLAATGLGCWLAALNLQYRDVKYVMPFLVQLLLFASPIVYPLALVPEPYRAWYALNPMVGVITGFRAVLLNDGPAYWTISVISAGAAVVVCLIGALYFRSVERKFADVA